MSRFKKIVRNIIIIAILSFLFLKGTGLYLSPLSAHEHSERSIHYGPSEVVHVEDFNNGKYMLGKYDKWISCNTVNRKLFFFWAFGNQVTGFENDKTKAVVYSWGGSYKDYKLYGIINDNRVKKIKITLDNGETFTQTKFYEDLFLFTWKSSNNENLNFKNIKGYDINDKIIFDEEY